MHTGVYRVWEGRLEYWTLSSGAYRRPTSCGQCAQRQLGDIDPRRWANLVRFLRYADRFSRFFHHISTIMSLICNLPAFWLAFFWVPGHLPKPLDAGIGWCFAVPPRISPCTAACVVLNGLDQNAWLVSSGNDYHSELERSTIFNGKIHYFDWAIFHSYVKLPEGIEHLIFWRGLRANFKQT